MMANLVSCGRRLWVCAWCVHAAFADHPVPIPYDAHIDARDMLRYSDLAPATRELASGWVRPLWIPIEPSTTSS